MKSFFKKLGKSNKLKDSSLTTDNNAFSLNPESATFDIYRSKPSLILIPSILASVATASVQLEATSANVSV